MLTNSPSDIFILFLPLPKRNDYIGWKPLSINLTVKTKVHSLCEGKELFWGWPYDLNYFKK